MIGDLIETGGIVAVLAIGIFIILIPIMATIILGMYIANAFHLTGIVWWAFMIIFYLVVAKILSAL